MKLYALLHFNYFFLPCIVFPDLSPIPPRDPVIHVVGEMARLQCGIQPGALAGQYFARWFNGTSGRILYNYPAPSQRSANPSLEMSESPRYNIDRSDLSLMISNVQRNDSFESYRCEVGVEDPRSPSRMTYFYDLTRDYNISLEVVGKYNSMLQRREERESPRQRTTLAWDAWFPELVVHV